MGHNAGEGEEGDEVDKSDESSVANSDGVWPVLGEGGGGGREMVEGSNCSWALEWILMSAVQEVESIMVIYVSL